MTKFQLNPTTYCETYTNEGKTGGTVEVNIFDRFTSNHKKSFMKLALGMFSFALSLIRIPSFMTTLVRFGSKGKGLEFATRK